MTIVEEIISETYHEAKRSIDATILRIAQYAILDCIGCMMLGSDDQTVKIMLKCGGPTHAYARGKSSLVGLRKRAYTDFAALINGASAHVMDYDDSSKATMGHPSAVLVPAILALGEEIGTSGCRLLESYVIGYQVMSQIGRMVNPQLHLRGWHSTAILGPLGAAAATSYLLGLKEKASCYSIGIAATLAAGLKASFGTMCKPLHCGHAARTGIMSSMLASEGFISSLTILEDADGLFSTHLEPKLVVRRRDPLFTWDIISDKPVFKQFACCSASHSAIKAVLKLKRDYSLSPEDVSRVKVGVNEIAMQDLKFNIPTCVMECRFSMPYCVALALIYGHVDPADFVDSNLNDPQMVQMMQRVDMYLDDQIAFLDGGEEPAQVSIICNDGRQLQEVLFEVTPLTDSELENKFVKNVSLNHSNKGAVNLLQIIKNLSTQDNITQLSHYLEGE